MNIIDKLFLISDGEYKLFQSSLLPTVEAEKIIGVRIPALRSFAKEFEPCEAVAFMNQLPHEYYDENNLHAFLIEGIEDIDMCYEELERFLPYIDNWATCDSLFPKVLKSDLDRLSLASDRWLCSEHTYTVRFAVCVLMRCFLDELYDEKYPEKIAAVVSDDYYVNMACAWYFATALTKQYDSVIRYFEEDRLSRQVHNKAISKACESYRIPKEKKTYLKKLRKKKTAE